ncbi:molybdate ABC transporter substrate-binding protein [Chachezhania antarctica]|uniref:molybdate ABC transporter substrate-binding protein n=1 Tax=Chachezhania antarctica TaxID=2340860 RepID=UPI000EB21485|nr:molybdate ABC transporter substrate-binding protein [Chachezhania antarctica]|tara:strand:+ start:3017 stop:3805 length:789 start_codon:yes stop_codon:yes gene_type:complete
MTRIARRLVLSAVVAIALLPMAGKAQEPVTVFAAASMKTALDEVAALWARDGNPPVRIAYAGSSLLARQIDQGAPADLFISANPDWMDWLQDAGMIRESSRRTLLTNALVLIAAPQTIAPGTTDGTVTAGYDIAAALGDGRLAVALVEAVPAGLYAKASLQALEQWDVLQPRLAETDNVRAALRLVASGEAPLGIVYRSDAIAEPAVRVLGTFPADSHPPILYPAALLPDAQAGAAPFLDFLSTPEAKAVFETQGFGTDPHP